MLKTIRSVFAWALCACLVSQNLALAAQPHAYVTPSQVTFDGASQALMPPVLEARHPLEETSSAAQIDRMAGDALTAEQWGRVEQAVHLFGLGEADKMYLAELWRQRLYPNLEKTPLRIGTDASKAENFILASDLTEEQRRTWLGTIPYAELAADPANAEAAKHISVIVNSLDGGIGENVGRLKWLITRAKSLDPNADTSQIKMGAKGTDLGYDVIIDGHVVFISIAEARLLQVIELARQKGFASISIQPLVNGQSRQSYERLFDSYYLFDRINAHKPDSEKFTYRQMFAEVGIKLQAPEEMLMQADLPGIEAETGMISLDIQGLRQPGGHGQWGVAFLWDAYRSSPPYDGTIHIRFFSNGDNVNSRLSESIAGYMVRHHIPILKLTTAATPIDKKGGKDGIRLVHVDGHVEYVPDQMELADAKAAGQTQAFYDAGQSGDASKRQPFNTNIIYLNLDLLHPILHELKSVIGEEVLARVISPALITKEAKEVNGKRYVPVDGAIGVAIHNLNAFFQTSRDPRIKAILEKHGVERLLRFVDVPREFFAPVKSTFDIWWQRYSDFYRFNSLDMVLEPIEAYFLPPEINLSSPSVDDPKKDDGYWNELQNLVMAFGHASTRKLKSLSIDGKVWLKDAELIGHVSIVNKTGRLVDLHDPHYAPLLKSFLNAEGRLLLDNTTILFSEDGRVLIHHQSPDIHPLPLRPRNGYLTLGVLRTFGIFAVLAAFEGWGLCGASILVVAALGWLNHVVKRQRAGGAALERAINMIWAETGDKFDLFGNVFESASGTFIALDGDYLESRQLAREIFSALRKKRLPAASIEETFRRILADAPKYYTIVNWSKIAPTGHDGNWGAGGDTGVHFPSPAGLREFLDRLRVSDQMLSSRGRGLRGVFSRRHGPPSAA